MRIFIAQVHHWACARRTLTVRRGSNVAHKQFASQHPAVNTASHWKSLDDHARHHCDHLSFVLLQAQSMATMNRLWRMRVAQCESNLVEYSDVKGVKCMNDQDG